MTSRIHIFRPEGLKNLILRDETFRVFRDNEYVTSPGSEADALFRRQRQWFTVSIRNGWNISLPAYVTTILSVTYFPILDILSRWPFNGTVFAGCPTQSFFLSLWFRSESPTPKALDEPTI